MVSTAYHLVSSAWLSAARWIRDTGQDAGNRAGDNGIHGSCATGQPWTTAKANGWASDYTTTLATLWSVGIVAGDPITDTTSAPWFSNGHLAILLSSGRRRSSAQMLDP